MNNLAEIYSCQKKFEKAENLYIISYEVAKKTFGDYNNNTILNFNNLALFYNSIGNNKKTENMFLEFELKCEKELGIIITIICCYNNYCNYY